MNFDVNEDQALFRATVERFVGAGDVAARKAARSGLAAARWAELAALGLLALPASAASGGLGGDPVDCAIVAEALGRGVAPDPWLESAYWPLRLIEGGRSGAELGERIASGATRVAVAFAEPAGRYQIEPRHVRATRSGEGWALSGTKHLVLAGEGADQYLVTAATEGGAGLFVVDAATTDAQGYALVDGSRAVTVTFRDAALPDAALPDAAFLGRVDETLADAVAETRLIAIAEMVGLADRLLDETLRYVRQREQFGQPIGRFQAIQHRLVDCYALVEQMRSTMWRTILTPRDAAGAWRAASAGAKGFVAERALHIGHEAIQFHGGMGMTDELIIGHAHKRVLLLSKLFGDPATDLSAYACAA